MREWLPPGEWPRLTREEAALEAEARARSSRSLVTDKERATLPPDALRQLAYSRWMAMRFGANRLVRQS